MGNGRNASATAGFEALANVMRELDMTTSTVNRSMIYTIIINIVGYI
jgi:hypothetical protein